MADQMKGFGIGHVHLLSRRPQGTAPFNAAQQLIGAFPEKTLSLLIAEVEFYLFAHDGSSFNMIQCPPARITWVPG